MVEAFKSCLREMYAFAVEKCKADLKLKFNADEYLPIVEDYFKLTIVKVPLYRKFSSYDEIVSFLEKHGIIDGERRKWFDLLKKTSYPPQPTELYPVLFEILESATNLESSKFEKVEQRAGWKCRLCGENLAILGDSGLNHNELAKLWNGEPLCPICLIKRYYRDYLREKEWKAAGFETVTDVCLRAWGWIKNLRSVCPDFPEKLGNLTKNGKPCDPDMYYVEFWTADRERVERRIKEWCKDVEIPENLEEVSREVAETLRRAYGKIGEPHGKIGEPPRYYAILKLDGDEMGKILSGRKGANVIDFAHESLRKDFERFGDVRRALTPSLHIAISQALSNFAAKVVPDIVKDHCGDLIYAGGDDVLAILPVDKAVTCAMKLADYFSSSKLFAPWHENGESGLTMSGGLLVVHYKHPLYDAIDRVNRLEKLAKDLKRNALAIGYLARSGNYSEAVVNWDIFLKLGKFVKLLRNSKENREPRLSERMIYHVMQEIENIPDDENAVKALLKYELSRHYSGQENGKPEVEEFIELASKVRINSANGEFEVGRINELIRDGKMLEELRTPKLRGMVLKEQVKGLLILLKILVDCKADLGGGGCENTDRT
jgi:CRISPR-associated protein Cmr2